MSDDVLRLQAPGHLAWIDLEMTGLDAQRDHILQAALIVTDEDLAIREEFVCDIWHPSEHFAGMNSFVRDMHERNGLLERCAASRTDLHAAEQALLMRVAAWCPYPAVLCGNTIGHDKKFIDRWMPGLSRYLSYRVIDVTSLKLLSRLWYGDAAEFQKPEEGRHDALVDIRNSIAELAHYRARFFKAP